MRRWRIFFVITSLFITAVFGSSSASAQAQVAPNEKLQISPLHTFISINPGESYAGSVQIKNSGSQTLSVTLSAEAFTIKNEQYDYTFLPDSPTNNWVRFLTPSLELKPDQSYDAKFLISIPIDAEPGGAYFSFFAASLPANHATIDSTDRVGSLFYIDIAGDTTKKGELLKFSSPWLHSGSTTPWSATIRNAGNVHFDSEYSVNLETLWGQPIHTTNGSHLILPQSVRLINDTVDTPRWIGVYKMTYSFGMGDEMKATGVKYLVFTPLSQLIPLALLTGLLILTAIKITKKYRKKH